MNEFKKNILRSRRQNIFVPFHISSSVVSAGTGTLDIVGGNPGETIGLSFEVTPEPDNFFSLNFESPVSVIAMDPTHLDRNGSMSLDLTGSGHSTYTFDPTSTTSSCLVTVLTRSSGSPTGIGDTTNIV